MDISYFTWFLDGDNSRYSFTFNDLDVIIRTGEDYSYPEDPLLDIDDYKEVNIYIKYPNGREISQEDFLAKINNNELNEFFKENKITNPFFSKMDIMVSIAELDKILFFMKNYVNPKAGTYNIQPCCKCKLNDHWNSLGKDNQWYCYLHCKY